MEAYTCLEVPVPDHDTNDINSYQLQKLRTTAKKYYKGKGPRRDSLLVNLRRMKFPTGSSYQRVLSHQGHTAAFLNALFTLREECELYKLVHVTQLEWVGNPIPHGPEGMSYVESPPTGQ